jgi:ABC-type transporter Mla MlaB component
MTTRRKPGKAGKTSAAPRNKAAATRTRASVPASRASGKRVSDRGAARARVAAKSSASGKSVASKATAAKGRTDANGSSAALAPFPADCTIAQAGDLKAQLARLLEEPTAVTLDLSAIRRIDTAALQVLTVFIRERRAAGRDVECRGASDAFLVTADVLGLRALFSPVTDDRLPAHAAGHA